MTQEEIDEEYANLVSFCKANEILLELTNNNVKFVRFLLDNRLGTTERIFKLVKKYQRKTKCNVIIK